MGLFQGRIISVSGIDGSGKTTIIENLTAELEQAGVSTSYVWLRYNHYLTKILLVFCRLIGLTVYENFEGGRVGYHNFYKSKIISYLFIWLTWIDTLIATLVTVYFPVMMGKTVVCDRWIADILIDLHLDTHLPVNKSGFAFKAFYSLIPKSALILMVDRSFDAIYQAREEHAYDKHLEKRFQCYQQLRDSGLCRVIDNTKSMDFTIEQVREVLQ